VWGVVAAASPEVIEPTSAQVETVTGTGIVGMTSRIEYRSGTLIGTGNPVGTEMTANPLGPDHPAGQQPSGANIWTMLVSDPGETNDRKYIRGHLLNHQVGGMGTAQNLFPITAAANDRHESEFESRIKTWVNTERRWVFYSVRIANVVVDVGPRRAIANNKINADIICSAHVVDPAQPTVRHNPITATIQSRFRGAAAVAAAAGAAGPVAVPVRAADLAATVAMPAGAEYRLDMRIFNAVQAARGRSKTDAQILAAIQNVSGVGSAIAATVMRAVGLSPPGGDIASRLLTPERSNLTQANGRAAAIASALNALT